MRHSISYGYGTSGFKDYGINFLTSEACGYGGTILTDLTPEGVQLMESFLGLSIKTGNGWNDNRPESASMMIPRGMIGDLAVFCLIYDGHKIVIHRADDYTAIGFTEEEWMAEDEDGVAFRDRYFKAYPNCRVYISAGTAGRRNRHEFTGRVE